jgi:membrane protease subunit HflK
VTELLQKTLLSYQSGIEVREVTLQSSKPPEAVTLAFDDVIKATEDQKRYINQAEAYAKKRVLTAQGEISRITQEADAYRYSTIAQATGASAQYLALLRPYQAAPAVTRERLYLETVTDVLKNSQNIIVEAGGNNVLYLPLEQMLRQSNAVKLTEPLTSPSNSAGPLPALENSESGVDNTRPSYPLEGVNR